MDARRYTIDDIKIVDDAVATIRRLYSKQSTGTPRASFCAASLIQQLILSGVAPTQINQRGAWIFVSSSRDWLASDDDIVSKKPFRKIVPFPEAGPNSHRMEILLTAFAAAVVTAGSDGVAWIVGNAEHHPLPSDITFDGFRSGQGRMVAFRFADGVG